MKYGMNCKTTLGLEWLQMDKITKVQHFKFCLEGMSRASYTWHELSGCVGVKSISFCFDAITFILKLVTDLLQFLPKIFPHFTVAMACILLWPCYAGLCHFLYLLSLNLLFVQWWIVIIAWVFCIYLYLAYFGRRLLSILQNFGDRQMFRYSKMIPFKEGTVS